MIRVAAFLLAFFLLAWPARAETASRDCMVPPELTASTARLTHVAHQVATGAPIKIVALGSSSTAGTGASSVQATYPAQLQLQLQRMFPRSAVTVLNKGVPGERVQQEARRFRRDVLNEHPDLLIWQTGTNSALMHGDVGDFVDGLVRGIDRAQAAGMDVVLMTPQLSPRFEAAPQRDAYLDYITRIADSRQVALIRRHEMMAYWLDSGQMTPAEMINPDGLHQTDRSYFCLGLVAARMIAALAVPPPPAVAAADGK